MTVVLTTRSDITLETFRRVAWEGEDVRIGPAALERMAACRRSFLALLESDPDITIYGVTTGYGQHAKIKLTPEQRERQARRPLGAAATSFGEPLPERVTRGIVLARLANYVDGHAAVSPELAEAVADMLAGGPLPRVPALGNGGAGEILPLSHLFSRLAEGFELGAKGGVALVNGSPCAAALIADAALAGRRRLDLAHHVFALSVEAFKTPLEHFEAALETLWGDEYEAAALRSLRAFLEGAGGGRRSYQAPVSFRILPRVLGQVHRTLAAAERAAGVSLASVSDNPVYLPPDEAHPHGRCVSNGGFHNAQAYPALDGLAAAWADLCLLADRHTTKMLDGAVSGLPNQLLVGDSDAYMGCVPMAQVGYGEQARHAAQRTFLPGSESGGFGQNDVSPPTFLAWRKEREAGECLDAALAMLAAVASQALHVTERDTPPRLKGLLDEVRGVFPPPVDRSPFLGRDCERLAKAFTDRVFTPAGSASWGSGGATGRPAARAGA